MKVIVPAYFDPGQQWDKLLATKDKPWAVVLNPFNGPGEKSDPDYLLLRGKLRKAGIKVFGYVYTSYATRAYAQIFDDIDSWVGWYGVEDIFLDEVTVESENITFYMDIKRKVSGQVILNHGQIPEPGYFAAGSILVVFEGHYRSYLSESLPDWADRERFCQIVHSTPPKQLKVTLNTLAEANDYCFVTDRRMPNPYDTLPSYYSKLVKACKFLDSPGEA